MLIKGKGATPKDGGCLVQIANWLADPTTWTDKALCVDPTLARLAIYANDIADDGHRRRLALLAPRLTGTKIKDEVAELDVENQLKGYVEANRPPEPMFIDHGLKWSKASKSQQTVIGTLNLDRLVIVDQDGLCDWLEGVLDEYDRITGRNAPELLTEQEWLEIKELVGQ